jgi:hypothetical protein
LIHKHHTGTKLEMNALDEKKAKCCKIDHKSEFIEMVNKGGLAALASSTFILFKILPIIIPFM